MWKVLRGFRNLRLKRRAERGATAVEYALMVGLIAVGIIASVSALRDKTTKTFANIESAIGGFSAPDSVPRNTYFSVSLTEDSTALYAANAWIGIFDDRTSNSTNLSATTLKSWKWFDNTNGAASPTAKVGGTKRVDLLAPTTPGNYFLFALSDGGYTSIMAKRAITVT